MVDGARGRSALARIVVYPGAYHDFDRENFPLHAIGGASDAGLPEKGHVGTDTEARADSQKRVAEWLARLLVPRPALAGSGFGRGAVTSSRLRVFVKSRSPPLARNLLSR